MSCHLYKIYSLPFSKEIRKFLIKKPQLVFLKRDKDINGLKEYFTNLSYFSNDTYPITVKCVNCNSPINTDIKYLSRSRYSDVNLYCSNCNHNFVLKITNDERDYTENIYCSIINSDTPNCNCDSCKNWLNSFTSYVENNIENFRNDLFNYIQDEIIETKFTLSLEQLYKIHKNSLTKTETELLNLCPQNIDDIYLLIAEMNNRNQKKISKNTLLKNLLNHGIIHEIIDENLLKVNIDEYISKYINLLNLIKSDKISQIFGGIYGLNIKAITPPYSISYITTDEAYYGINFCSIDIGSIKKYSLNKYYLNHPKTIIAPKRYNIFNSPAENTLFNHLKRMYPNYIICPNAPLRVFAKTTELSKHFTATEIEYLKYCIIDFVIADKEGYVVKCIELQKGNHHNNKDWIYKDSLKRKCFDILGIDLSYEY